MAEIPTTESPTLTAIYRSYESAIEERRGYLGMSTMGDECDRALWYGFRWASAPEILDGRKLRLFKTGHREEARMIQDLKDAGIEVEETDPLTGEQFAYVNCGGHFRGHADARAIKVPEAPVKWHILECKTHNEKSFKALVKDGVAKSKPAHWMQMQSYMHHDGTDRALYMAHNKNTDELYIERVNYDAVEALKIVARADRIINAPTAPAKLHDDPKAKMAFQCGWCPSRPQCHDGAFALVNCRTCLHSTPVPGGWNCERHNRALTIEDQRAGCPDHLFIPALVPGEQVDADETTRTVVYSLATGEAWTDGPGKAALEAVQP